MPNRVIREALLDSDRYLGLTHDSERLVFLELILLADDFGLVPLHFSFLRRRVSPCAGRTEAQVMEMIGQLVERDLLRVYRSESGAMFGYIPRFGNVPRATKPKWPTPPDQPSFADVHAMLGGKGKHVWFYVYRITHIPSGRFYIGSRSSTKPPAEDAYFGSGAACKWLVSNRQHCEKVLVQECESVDAARTLEALMIAENAENVLCLNIAGLGDVYRNQGLSGILHSESTAKTPRMQPHAPETETETETETATPVAETGGTTKVVGAPRKRSADKPASRGTRLPQDWALPKAWGQWAVDDLNMQPDAVRAEAAKFADYWHAKAGRDAAKADWLATWRNWCRSALDRAPRRATLAPVFAGKPLADPVAEQARRDAENAKAKALLFGGGSIFGGPAAGGDVIEGEVVR